jgi:TM2 domain-containing membrane protein YozV
LPLLFLKTEEGFNCLISMKTKLTATALALLVGSVGGHRFYLRQPWYGVLYLLFSWSFIPAFIGFIDFLSLFTMSSNDFHLKYNFDLTTAVPVIEAGMNGFEK